MKEASRCKRVARGPRDGAERRSGDFRGERGTNERLRLASQFGEFLLKGLRYNQQQSWSARSKRRATRMPTGIGRSKLPEVRKQCGNADLGD